MGFLFYKIMNYSEQLKSPKWQKKRLEIMQRDKFTCQLCGDKVYNSIDKLIVSLDFIDIVELKTINNIITKTLVCSK